MCGLIGTVNIPLNRSVVDLLTHRGPDGEGLTSHDCGSHKIWLGHRRLAIVELSENGAQPMATPDGKHVVIFNGEIYNHAELRRGLSGISFRGHSDTETLLHSLAMSGADAVRDLNGIFAFAWLDLAAGRLVLARDPFGVKPLYYSANGNQFGFASELKPLLELVPRSIDPDKLATLLKLRFSPSPDTLIRGVYKLRPGHLLEVRLDGGSPVIREYPYMKSLPAPEVGLNFGSAVERYGVLFSTAVQRQLMSDVEIGVLLSGGVDSAAVAAIAQRHSAAPLKAFTVGFKDADSADADEIDDARETASALGLEHHSVRIGFEDFLASLRDCVRVVEEPLATTSIVPMRFLAQLAASHVKVVLSGQGADEPLGGYERYQAEIVGRYIPRVAARLGRGLVRALHIRGERLGRGLESLSQGDDIGRFIEAYAVFTDAEIGQLIGRSSVTDARSRLEYFYRLLRCGDLAHPVARMMALDLRLGLADDLLLYTDKITMRSSLECRVPILDLELVAFIESLPYIYRVRYGSKKIIHKAFAERLLPAAIVKRRKKGFWSPTGPWFRNAGLLRSILLDKGSKFAGFFDLSAVDRTITQHQQGYNRERHIFLLLCLYYWLAEYA